jgi:hypothetical protein
VAVTFIAASMVNEQDVPVQSPENPAKLEETSAKAESVTWVPGAKLVEQVAPQSMPAGIEITEPAPAPASVTATVKPGVAQTPSTPCPPQVCGEGQGPH